ncbi:MAG TPA: SH3 domain-containing protein [Chloroflexota bacterium]|nr:SH3 domain-containing protein [Chloroflexota bacterium]
MSLGERLREMLDPGATAGSSGTNGSAGSSGPPSGPTRRRPRSQAQPVNPVRSYDTDSSRPMPRAQWIGLGLAAALAVALTAGLVFVVLTMVRPGTQTAVTPTPLPVVASPTIPASVAQIFATSTPPPNAPTPTPPGVGQRLQVANTGNEGANLRREPGSSGDRLKTIPDGTLVEVVGPDSTVDGIIWKNVRDPQGETGWIAGSYLAAEGSQPVAGIPGSSQGPAGAPSAARTPAAPRPTTAVASSSATRGQVGNTNGQGANIRSEPGPNGRILKTLAEGATIEVLGPEREVDGQVWRQVRDTQSGVTGWIVRGAVAPAGSVATPAPVVTRAPAAGPTSGPATKPSTGSGTTPGTSSTPAPAAKPTTPPGDLPIIIQPATPRPQAPQITAPTSAPAPAPATGGTPRAVPTKPSQ